MTNPGAVASIVDGVLFRTTPEEENLIFGGTG